MKNTFCRKALCAELVFGLAVLAFVSLTGSVSVSIAAQGKVDSAKIEQLTGMKGEMNEKRVCSPYELRARICRSLQRE